MSKTARVSISMPEELLAWVEREQAARSSSRSEVFQFAVEELIRQRSVRELEARYVEGYRRDPETADEGFGWATISTAFEGEPWD